MWFQSGTANKMIRSLPYVFTEQGLSIILKSNVVTGKVIKPIKNVKICEKSVKL